MATGIQYVKLQYSGSIWCNRLVNFFVQNGSYGYDDSGVRAQVFSNHQKSLYVIAIKGTSAGLWPGKNCLTKRINTSFHK